MKLILLTLSSFCILFNICQAQKITKRTIPLLEASSKVDSLLSRVIAASDVSTLGKDPCFLFIFDKKNYDVGNILSVQIQDHEILSFPNFKDQKNLGFFRFKGYLIFAYGDDLMNEFFKKTQVKNEFSFIKPTTAQAIVILKDQISWALFYKNGDLNYGVH